MISLEFWKLNHVVILNGDEVHHFWQHLSDIKIMTK